MALATQGDEVKAPHIPTDQIVSRFDASIGTWDERKASEAMRAAFQNMAAAINDDIVDSRAKSQALTLLEDASMWVQKAIFEDAPKKSSITYTNSTSEVPPRVYVWEGGKDERLKQWLGSAFVAFSSENVPGQAKDRILLTYVNTVGAQSVVDDQELRTFEKLVSGRIYLHVKN